jgi:hypothetical protein
MPGSSALRQVFAVNALREDRGVIIAIGRCRRTAAKLANCIDVTL